MTPPLTLSPIIMGTWQAAKQYWPGVEDAELEAAVDRALELGVTSFDTAEEYGDGHSERLLGKALGSRRPRAQILTKVFSNHLRRAQVIEACERSLTNLGTDYIDLYQIHWPAGSWGSEVVPIGETMEALLQLRQQGKIRAIGVSNFTLEQLREANADGHIYSLQPPYSLFWRHIDTDIRPYCEAAGIRILAYGSLAQGLLSGKYTSREQLAKGDNRKADKLFHEPNLSRALAALEQLRPIAARLGVELAALALAWCMAQRLTHPIVGVRNAAQIASAAGAMHLQLDAEVLADIDAIGRTVSDPVSDDPLLWNWQP